MTFVIFHFHFRAGGVRRVIELTAPQLLRESPQKISRVILLTGEKPDEIWLRGFIANCHPVSVEVVCDSSFGYFSEQARSPTAISNQIRNRLDSLRKQAEKPLIWAHNLSVGRNWFVARAFVEKAREGAWQLVLHHHDWWFDQRWDRIQELEQAGADSLTAIAKIFFSPQKNIRHVAINRRDARLLSRRMGNAAIWLPNPILPQTKLSANRHLTAREWLYSEIGEDAPVWIFPCRLLRRKNIAEALLLTRWLRPEAWLVTTGGVSSAAEKKYAFALDQAVKRFGWRLKLGIVAENDSHAPEISDLMAVSEVVLMTSIQEGFGLPYLESIQSQRPLIARRIPSVLSDLENFGIEFPQLYDEVFIDTSLFDWRAEWERQNARWKNRLEKMPAFCRAWFEKRWRLADENRPEKIAFSRLTFEAQIEVLTQPIAHSLELCAPLNSWLAEWRESAQNQDLRLTQALPKVFDELSGKVFAQRFFSWLAAGNFDSANGTARDVLDDFFQDRQQSESLFPLLW